MTISDRELLKRLGTGEKIEALCQIQKWSRGEFDAWWNKTLAERVPSTNGSKKCALNSSVDIIRDAQGVPHIHADNEDDLFFGYGYAMAQDRLFQLDWLRRKGAGRLAEIVGKSGYEYDLLVRTVGLRRIAEQEWSELPASTKNVLTAFTAGINAVIDESKERLPIEFSLLDYQPERWTEIDSLTIEVEFRWYLTGRFPVIVMPELVKRAVGEGPLFDAYCVAEADDESIMPPGSYAPKPNGEETIVRANGEPQPATGSNNWVVAGSRTTTGKPFLASDPHIAFEAVSCWYMAHLHAGDYHVAGMTYVGMPTIMFGRNTKTAWGITNNICSQRDLYQEQTDDAHPGCFLYDGTWEKAREIEETIHIKGEESVRTTVTFSRNGPLVNDVLPPPANKLGPVSVKWVGAYGGGFLTALLAMNRANNVKELQAAMKPWFVPTFCLVLADVDGHIGFRASGRLALRKHESRGFRPGWDPEHQWTGFIPFEEMPSVIDPPRGWMGSANGRLAPPDFPYPQFGRWVSGYRLRRVRQMIEARDKASRDDMRDMHQDAVSLRAVDRLPALLKVLGQSSDPQVGQLGELLAGWNGSCETDSVAATVFNVFVIQWAKRVAAERLDAATASLVVAGVEALSMNLLESDPAGWFAKGDSDRLAKIHDAAKATFADLTNRLGDNPRQWTWGRLHTMSMKHVLSPIGDLGQLLDQSRDGVRGDMSTVCNTGRGPDYQAMTGAGYRLIADLQTSPPMLHHVDAQSNSGHPGSKHYRDQFDAWVGGEYYPVTLDCAVTEQSAVEKLRLEPQK
ncbi:MAG: penicillin acylase family protein [Planctomycetota bacterium]|nr:penicillin acylase family protein [Planctomycetota bacterium]MDA1212968.1 penicillin acylase family protein [Planctomycetota bacterium]